MELGIDSFAAIMAEDNRVTPTSDADRMQFLLEEIITADRAGVDTFGIGEHHRAEYLDSAPAVILGAAAARTKRVRLTSAVTVLSAADPVRVFQEFATLDLISRGRAEMVVGRGSSIEAFPLFGFDLKDYDELFADKASALTRHSGTNIPYLVWPLSPSPERPRYLSSSATAAFTDLVGRRRYSRIFHARGRTGLTPHGRDHRRPDPPISSAR